MPALDIPSDLQPLSKPSMGLPDDLQPIDAASTPQNPIISGIMQQQGPMTDPERQTMQQSLAAQLAHPIGSTTGQVSVAGSNGMSIKPVSFDEPAPQGPSPVAGLPQEKSGVANALAAGVSSWADPLANLGIRAAEDIGLVSHDRAQQAINTHPLPYDANRVSGKVGAGVGLAAEAVAAGPAAPYLFAAQGAEQGVENIEANAQQGQAASQAGQIADVAGKAALNYAMGRLAPGQKLNSQIIKGMMPELRSVAANAAKNVMTSTGVHAAEGAAFQIADNAITKYTGVNPNQDLTEGVGENALQNGIMGGAGQALHEGTALLGRTPKVETPAPVSPEQPMLDEVQQQITSNQKTIAENNRLLGRAPAEAETAQPEPTQFEQKPEPSAPQQGVLARMLADEGGGDKAIQKFAEKSVVPEAKSWWEGMKGTWKNVNRFIGSGLGETDDANRVGGSIRSSLGEQDLDRIRTEQQFKPHRDIVDNYTPDQKTKWVEAMESGQKSPDPKTQGAFDFMRRLNQQNKQDASAVGIDTSKWDSNDDWVGRMAVFPDEKGGPGSTSSIAGSEHYLKGRVFKTYGEFKTAVEAAGGKMRYENPIDVTLAKQAEIRKSIEARKIVDDEMAKGTVRKLKPGETLPEGMQYLDDRLAKKMVKAQLWIDKAGDPNMRPAPRLIAPDAVANKLNQFIAPGISKTLPIWSKIVQMKRNSIAINFALSAFHVPIEAVSNSAITLGQALDNVMHGELGLAGKNVRRALPWEQAKFGSAIREQAKNAKFDPSLEPLVKATAEAGQRFNVRSLLDPNSFEKAKIAFRDENPIAGTYHLLRGVGEAVTAPIMEKYVPNLKAGAMGIKAETLLSRGLSPEEIKAEMMKTSDNVDNMLGQVVRSNQFQHKIIQDINDGIFSAPKFTEGALRFGGSLARDTALAFKDVAQGKKPTLTPAMYTLAGYAITHATLGAAIQMAYTAATNGKPTAPSSLKDYFYPQTGRKNADGTPERIELPDPMSFFISSYNEGPMKALGNRVAPLWRAVMDAVNNSDYRNVEVRDTNAGVGTQVGQVAKHIAKSQVPFSVGNALQRPTAKPETTDLQVGGLMGIRRAPSSVNQSSAEAAASDVIVSKLPRGTRTPEEADKSDLKSSILTGIRSKNPDTTTQMRDAFKTGKLTTADLETIQKRATGPTGLMGKLQSPDISATDAMQTVWPRMTDEEKQKTQYVVRRKIMQSTDLTPAQRQTFIKQINTDTKGAR